MKHKKTITAIMVLMFVASASAIEVLNINIDNPDGTQPTVNELVDINATVDGQGTATTDVRYSIYENNTAIEESVLMQFNSGDTKEISYWFEDDTFELKNNTFYELSVVGVDNKGQTDELLLKVNTSGTEVETTFSDVETPPQDFFSKLLREFNLHEGFFNQGLSDLTIGEILFIIMCIVGALYIIE